MVNNIGLYNTIARLGVRSSVENILCRLPNVPAKLWLLRNMSHGSVKLLISEGENKPKFETYEVDPPKKYKWLTKKRLKIQRKKEKQQRKAANKRDPRWLGIKGKRKTHKFANAEDKIKYKLEKLVWPEPVVMRRCESEEKTREKEERQSRVFSPTRYEGQIGNFTNFGV